VGARGSESKVCSINRTPVGPYGEHLSPVTDTPATAGVYAGCVPHIAQIEVALAGRDNLRLARIQSQNSQTAPARGRRPPIWAIRSMLAAFVNPHRLRLTSALEAKRMVKIDSAAIRHENHLVEP
jgi:hypothetical protein